MLAKALEGIQHNDLKLWVADGEEIIRLSLKKIDGMMGLAVPAAADGHEACAQCPAILITGCTHYQQLILKNDIKPDGFITKPCSLEKIARNLIKIVSETGFVT